jgi:DNA-binding MarR family transcriptional regulator
MGMGQYQRGLRDLLIPISPKWLGLNQTRWDRAFPASSATWWCPEDMAQRPPAEATIIKLRRRDIEDASRLLSLIANAEGKILVAAEDTEELGQLKSDGELQERALTMLAHRRRRHNIFGKAMFGEPAWEMLLLLYVSESGPRQTVTRLAKLACASKSTALRWIEYLEGQQLVQRDPHPTDKRALFVSLTAKGKEAIELFLNDTGAQQD